MSFAVKISFETLHEKKTPLEITIEIDFQMWNVVTELFDKFLPECHALSENFLVNLFCEW